MRYVLHTFWRIHMKLDSLSLNVINNIYLKISCLRNQKFELDALQDIFTYAEALPCSIIILISMIVYEIFNFNIE